MKQIKHIAVILLVLSSQLLHAQNNHDSWMITDMDIYVSGETLLSKIYVPQDQQFQMLCLSLSSNDGLPVTSVKLSIENHQAAGSLYLPDSLSTGSYLITAYSCHYERQAFFSKEIIVLNRFENQDQELTIERGQLEEMVTSETNQISVSGLKSSYKQRENGVFSISLDEALLSELEGELSVIISEDVPGWKSQYLPIEPNFEKTMLLTEKRGVVMQGKVTNTETGNPVNGATVFLSIPDSIPYFDYYNTDPEGQFFFMLEEFYGSFPMFIQAIKEDENDQLKIQLVENVVDEKLKFDTHLVELPISTNEYFADAISMTTFRKVYQVNEYEYATTKHKTGYPFPFYGRADVQVDPDDYVELSDFNEISKELLSPVRFRNRKDVYSLNIFDRELDDYFTDEPLMMIDGVPVQDLRKIANLSSSDIDWIDVVPYQRFYGNQRYDGVLSIFTKDLNGSLIFSSDRILKLEYETLQEETRLAELETQGKNMPDFKQVLLWEPELKAERNNQLQLKTSDIKGTFKVQISGRKKNGEMTQLVQYFTVTE